MARSTLALAFALTMACADSTTTDPVEPTDDTLDNPRFEPPDDTSEPVDSDTTEPDPGPSAGELIAEFCEKMTYCSYIQETQFECETLINECVDELRPSLREPWLQDIAFCLSRDTCDDIWACYQSMPYC